MRNIVFPSIQHSIIKPISSAIIILGLFSFAPIANTNLAAPAGNQTEQLITKGVEKTSCFYSISTKPVYRAIDTIYKARLKAYNGSIAVQYLSNKVNIFSLDQRITLKHFIYSHSDQEDYFLNSV